MTKAKLSPNKICEVCEKKKATDVWRKIAFCGSCLEEAEADEAETRGTNHEDYEQLDEEDCIVPRKTNPIKKDAKYFINEIEKLALNHNYKPDELYEEFLNYTVLVREYDNKKDWNTDKKFISNLKKSFEKMSVISKANPCHLKSNPKISHRSGKELHWKEYKSLLGTYIYLEQPIHPFHNVKIQEHELKDKTYFTVFIGDGYKVISEKSFDDLGLAVAYAEKYYLSCSKK